MAEQSTMLMSWKEIAQYLGKGVRTVQRWEMTLALPVRRPDGQAQGKVYAARDELDEWLKSRWSARKSAPESFVPVTRHANEVAQSDASQLLRAANRQLRTDVEKHMQSLMDSLGKCLKSCDKPHSGNGASGK